MKHYPRLLVHPLQNGTFILVYTVKSRHGLMFKHLKGTIPFGEQQRAQVMQQLGSSAYTFMQLSYSPYPY